MPSDRISFSYFVTASVPLWKFSLAAVHHDIVQTKRNLKCPSFHLKCLFKMFYRNFWGYLLALRIKTMREIREMKKVPWSLNSQSLAGLTLQNV